MNFKRAVIIFLITCFVLTISVSAVLCGNFQNRITVWEQIGETDREHREERISREERSFREERDAGEEGISREERFSWEEEKSSRENERISREEDESGSDEREQERYFKERRERDLEEIPRYFQLSWGDLVLLAGCAAIELALGIWYWALGLIAAYRKAYRMGVNGRLAVLAALFFNLAAVALYLYGMLKGTCANCGRVRSGNGKFCGRCGSPLKKECPQCRQEVDISSAYCSNCGKKLNGDKETENKR